MIGAPNTSLQKWEPCPLAVTVCGGNPSYTKQSSYDWYCIHYTLSTLLSSRWCWWWLLSLPVLLLLQVGIITLIEYPVGLCVVALKNVEREYPTKNERNGVIWQSGVSKPLVELVVFHQRSHFTKGPLPLMVVVHWRLSSIEGHLSLKVISNQTL